MLRAAPDLHLLKKDYRRRQPGLLNVTLAVNSAFR